MPTIQPRINVTLDPERHRVLKAISKEEGVSLSQVASNLINCALELGEDMAIVKNSATRLETFTRDDAFTSKDLLKWNKTRKGKK